MDLLQRSVAEYEKEFEMLEKYQITDPQDPDFGGYYNKDFGVVAQNCGSAAAKPMTLYFCPQSRYYKDPRALACADGLVQHLLNHLHPDGTMDYYSCNFHSAPDTAFVTLALAKPAKLVKAETPEEKAFQKKLFLVLRRMGDGMVEEGFHTPNHRWVISAALALLNTLMPDERYVARIDQYLAEHIDCNEDGEYAERSAGGYNEINNRALLILAQDLGKTELLEYVRRNLEMMPVFYHTDFSIFTENSRRQDKGTAPYAEKYAYQYLLCGHALHDEALRAIGTAQLEACIRCGRCVAHCPANLMPLEIESAFKQKNVERLAELKVNLCMECGCCAHGCPASRPLVQTNKLAKAQVAAWKAAKKAADEAKKAAEEAKKEAVK